MRASAGEGQSGKGRDSICSGPHTAPAWPALSGIRSRAGGVNRGPLGPRRCGRRRRATNQPDGLTHGAPGVSPSSPAVPMARLGNLTTRILVAVIAIPLLLLVIYQEHHEVVWGVVFLASLLVMHELLAMTVEEKADRIAGLVIGAAVVAGFYWLPPRWAPTLLPFLAAFFAPALYYLFRPGDIATVAQRLAFTSLAILYGGLLFSFLALVKRDLGPAGSDTIVLLL